MTPETKAWFEEFKNRCLGYTPADMFTHCWSDNKQCIQIIESQDKEIERLKCELSCAISICSSQYISNLEQVSGVAELLRSKKDI